MKKINGMQPFLGPSGVAPLIVHLVAKNSTFTDYVRVMFESTRASGMKPISHMRIYYDLII